MAAMRWEICLLLVVAVCSTQAQQRCDTSAYPPSSPDARFEDAGDGTLTDTRSGLMWLRCSAGQTWQAGDCQGQAAALNWAAAHAAAEYVNRRGDYFYNDWRLPRLAELATLAERQCDNPRINLGLFPGTPARPYWTGSSRPGAPSADAAYALSFGGGGVEYDSKRQAAHVRLVRHAR